MKKRILSISFLLFLCGCELFDPTQDAVNPNLTLDAVLGTPSPMRGWINGLERQNAIVYNNHVTLMEIGSDNYVNTRTFYNQQFDRLNILFQDANVNAVQFSIADLRQSAVAGLTTVQAADPSTTPEQVAELHFFKGWAELLAGELFVVLPNAPGGVPFTAEQNLQAAVQDFIEAETRVPTSASYKLALARAYYRLGDKANAGTKASEALALDNDFLRAAQYDQPNGLTSTIQDALFDRGNFDDLQPLPRLDFLDPKHYGRSATVESPTYFQKAEEAHLILAEIALSNNNVAQAKTHMTNCLTLVQSRQVDSFSDAVENRIQATPGSRPDRSTVRVRASAADPFRTGLVLTRNAGNVSIPVISGTSLTAAQIAALSTEDEVLENLYLMRQEIFIAEGRRFTDLGLRLPLSENELLTNANVTQAMTLAKIPAFVPTDMDAIEYDRTAGECTIKTNMNKVLVANKTSADVLPFH